MEKTITYTIVITKQPKGFVATCLAFSDCVTLGRNRGAAYKSIKDLIRRRLAKLIDEQRPIPRDRIVSVKYLRLNLLDIYLEVNLR
jgi:predicted RNase H-like HicB family nuclease